jgi:hypothetical protein
MLKKGDKVKTPKGVGIVKKNYGQNVKVEMDLRDLKNRITYI